MYELQLNRTTILFHIVYIINDTITTSLESKVWELFSFFSWVLPLDLGSKVGFKD